MDQSFLDIPSECLDNAVYLLKLRHPFKNATYLGSTNDTKRRWRQHEGKRAGGAKYTKIASENHRYSWDPVCVVRGFPTRGMAYSFEKRAKHIRLCDGDGTLADNGKYDANDKLVHQRVRKMIIMCNLERWSKKCPPAATIPLRFEWYMPQLKPAADDFLRRDWEIQQRANREILLHARRCKTKILEAVGNRIPLSVIGQIIVPYHVQIRYLPYYVEEVVIKQQQQTS